MDEFQKVFKNRHVILPVVHTVSLKQVISNTTIALESGADGVFLINHRISYLELLYIYEFASAKFSGFWIGVNFLDLRPFETFDMIFKKGLRVAGVWVDNARIDGSSRYQYQPEEIKKLIIKNNWNGLYFGGVAFKYQPHIDDLEKAARIAWHFMDVITTSGPATGEPAEIEKIRRMKSAIGRKPLAIASGITSENVRNYLMADCFLVATGISWDFANFNPGKLSLLVKTVRETDRKEG